MDTKDRDELNAYTGANRTQHTPGPWHIIGDQNIWPVNNANHTDDRIAVVYRDSNAHLIAAAPELLRSLIFLLNCCEMNMDDMEPESLVAIDEARTAISRATGRE